MVAICVHVVRDTKNGENLEDMAAVSPPVRGRRHAMPGLSAACLLALASVTATASGAASFQLSKLDASIPQAQGGRCMDGTMAGYYVREGTDGRNRWPYGVAL